jgi:hypothetical protein
MAAALLELGVLLAHVDDLNVSGHIVLLVLGLTASASRNCPTHQEDVLSGDVMVRGHRVRGKEVAV